MNSIVFLITNFYHQVSGGAEYQSYILAKKTSKEYKTYYVGQNKKDYNWVFRKDGMIVILTKKKKISRIFGNVLLIDLFKILKILQIIRPKVIYTRGLNAYLLLAILYKYLIKNCKVIWHVASEGDVNPKIKPSATWQLLKLFEQKVCKWGITKADVIICQAIYQTKLLYSNYQKKCNEVVMNYAPPPAVIKEKDDNVLNILWVGNIKENKHPETFIQIANTFANYPHIRFYMIGRMNKSRRYKSLFANLENDRLLYVGEKYGHELDSYYEEGHVLINTSCYEGFPNTFIQAWYNKMIVISQYVDPDEIITDNNIGYVNHKISEICNYIKFINDNRNYLNERAIIAQKIAYDKFSLENINTLVSIFRKV